MLSVGNVFRRIWMPYHTELVETPGKPGFHDITRNPAAPTIPGCAVYRFDAPLIFANARSFNEEMFRLAAREPYPEWIVVASEPITDVDTTACDMLEDLVPALEARGVRLVFAEMKAPVRQKLKDYGIGHVLEGGRFFPTLESAVAEFHVEHAKRDV
jgi:MFS superfamily sulfate permease-like transporter